MNYLKSFQNKIVFLIAVGLIITAALITAIGLRHTRSIQENDARQIMSLLCTENANKLNGHFRSAEQTVHILSNYIMEELERTDEIYNSSSIDSLIENVRIMSYGAANNVENATAVYLRLNPDLFTPFSGFFLTRNHDDFRETPTTDLTAYEPTDIGHVGWYYLPMKNRSPMWMMPYYNKNIHVYMISYVIPIFLDDTFIGVIGMDLDLDSLQAMINERSISPNNYAYLSDQNGEMIYETQDRSAGIDWITLSQELTNGMTLSVTIPSDEINPSPPVLFRDIIFATLAVMIDTIGLTTFLAVRLNHTLRETLLEAQESQRRASDAATKANNAKSEFLSRMSHDIRTPLNGISGMIQILRRNRHNPEKVDDCIQKIEISATYLLSLLNDILDLQKLESGKMVLSRHPFDLNELLNSCIVITETLAAEQAVTINVSSGEIRHPILYGSPTHIRQIFLNVLSNAVKYNKPHGSISILTEELPPLETKARFSFCFEDTGIGMSEEYLAHIFEPFSQENPGARTTYTGTGLGMSIIKKLIDSMGGSISIASRQGEGTTVRITLDFEIAENITIEPANIDQNTVYPGTKVLVAEDNAINMEITKYLLEDIGIEVTPVKNGQEAVDCFIASASNTYDLILMDIMMPIKDGITAAQEIRALPRPDASSVPIIALTSNAFTDEIKKCQVAGMNEHLAKPLDLKRIYSTLSRYIPQRKEDSRHES